MTSGRNYQIPDGTIGFYGTGISGVDLKIIARLQEIVKPVGHFFDSKIDDKPVHITCRYLGYYDETKEDEVDQIAAKLKSIFNRYLPLKVEAGKLFGTWELDPNAPQKSLMLVADNPNLAALHQELIAQTPGFPLFSGVEGIKYHPHLTLAKIKKEYTDAIPQEVLEYIQAFNAKFDLTFTRAYLWKKDSVINL